MKPFAKIIDTISSKKKLYTTPFLNFDYLHRTTTRKIEKNNTDTLRKHLQNISKLQADAEKRKQELNKGAFTRILTEEENKELAEIFTFLEQKKSAKERLLMQMKHLSLNG